ncbi:hypothetical protein GCM10027422_10420 [Hymenobacter arcticus]
MAPQPPVHILDQHQFDKYAAAWSRHVSHHQDLTAVFQQPDGSPMQAVRLSFPIVEYLLSTVGAQQIKAQFLLKEEEKSGEKLFVLALYATDALGGRVSAYYLAEYMPPVTTPTSNAVQLGATEHLGADDQVSSLGDQIPNELVHTWLNNWKQASLKTAHMFGSNYGPLTGYTFDMGDFLDSFFYANKFKEKELLILFGLHQHYPAFPNCYTLKQTFGLVLRIRQITDAAPKTEADFAADREAFVKTISATNSYAELTKAALIQATGEDAGQPFYDFSRPSPPN